MTTCFPLPKSKSTKSQENKKKRLELLVQYKHKMKLIKFSWVWDGNENHFMVAFCCRIYEGIKDRFSTLLLLFLLFQMLGSWFCLISLCLNILLWLLVVIFTLLSITISFLPLVIISNGKRLYFFSLSLPLSVDLVSSFFGLNFPFI